MGGSIDFTEFMLIYHIMSEGTPQEVLGKFFSLFVIYGDGTISKKEMARLIKDEDLEAKSQTEIANIAFAEMDADGDGIITLPEFISACLSQDDKAVSKMLAIKVLDIFLGE